MSGERLPRSGCEHKHQPVLSRARVRRAPNAPVWVQQSLKACTPAVTCPTARGAAQEAALSELRTALSSHGVPQDKRALLLARS